MIVIKASDPEKYRPMTNKELVDLWRPVYRRVRREKAIRDFCRRVRALTPNAKELALAIKRVGEVWQKVGSHSEDKRK